MRWAPLDYQSSTLRARSIRTDEPLLRLLYLEILFALHASGGTLSADPEELEDTVGLAAQEIGRLLPVLLAFGQREGRGGLQLD
ncbi:MAG: hypothetical protein K8J08_02915, partial [Thermoanaerobaculia bacterium]|nr:hypothetical protein [Thermoanaerobaculia bacterium]